MIDEKRLAALANKTRGGWVSQTNPHYPNLVKAGLVEVRDGPDEDGDLFYALTELGEQWLEARSRGEPTPALQVVEEEPVEQPVEQPIEQPIDESAANEALEAIEAVAPLRQDLPGGYEPTVQYGQRNVLRSAICDEIDVDDVEWNRPRPDDASSPSSTAAALNLEALPVGSSRHIASTPERPDPERHYASYVKAANMRNATLCRDSLGHIMLQSSKDGKRMRPAYTFQRKYVLFRCHDDDPRGPGARILRVL